MRSFMRTAGVLLLASLSLVFMSCSPASSKGPVKIQIMIGFGGGTDPSQAAEHEALQKEFNEGIGKEKGIELEFMTVQYAEANQKFTTLVAGGMTPDICGPVGVRGVATFIDEWIDITPYLKKDKMDLSVYDDALIKTHHYIVDRKEKQVGLPIGFYPSVMYYNEDIFDRAGIMYPPTTWGTAEWTNEKMTEIARKMTLDKSGKTPNDAGFDPKNIVQYGYDGTDWAPCRAFIGKFANPLGMSADYKKAEMNTPEWNAAFAYVEKQVHKDFVRPVVDPSNNAATFGDNSPMGSNKLAMWEIFSWIGYEYESWDSNFKWNVAAIPTTNGKISAATNSDTFVISKSGKNHDQAWEVYKWLYSPEVYARLAKLYGCIPAVKTLQAAWVDEQKVARPNINWQVFLDAGKYADNPNNEAWVPNMGKIWDAMEKAMADVISGNYVSIADVTNKLNVEVQGYLDEYWAAKK